MHVYDSGLTQQKVYEHLHQTKTYGLLEHGAGTYHLYKGFKSLLDVGCGRTRFAHRVRKMHKLSHVCVCDISLVAVEYQIKQFNIPAMWADLTRHLPCKTNEFDAVTAFDVLEHLPPDAVDTAIKELSRVARRRMVFTIAHNAMHHNGPNGEPLHLTLKPLEWWHEKIKSLSGGKIWTEQFVMRRRKDRTVKRYGLATVVDL